MAKELRRQRLAKELRGCGHRSRDGARQYSRAAPRVMDLLKDPRRMALRRNLDRLSLEMAVRMTE